MQRQLDLWPTSQKTTQAQQIWKNLDYQQRTNVIAALARLIGKMVYSENPNDAQEKKDID